jgi:hypothetical protein
MATVFQTVVFVLAIASREAGLPVIRTAFTLGKAGLRGFVFQRKISNQESEYASARFEEGI